MKKEAFKKRDIELAELSRSVGHPARFYILNALAKNEKMTTSEFVAQLPLSQATVSQHLKVLVDEGLVCRFASGTKSIYTLEWNKLERMLLLFQKMKDEVMVFRPKRNCC